MLEGRHLQPTCDNVLVRQLEPHDKHADRQIMLLHTTQSHTPARVLAIGRDVYGGIVPGATVLVEGFKSGIRVDRGLYLVSQELVVGVVIGG